jgi:ribose transport system substrate-binding protein
MSCGVPACNLEGNIIKGVTDKLGWSFKMITTSGTPQSTQAAWQSAVRLRPSAVFYTGVPSAPFVPEIKELQAAGAVVVAGSVPDSPPVDAVYLTAPQEDPPVARLWANWVTAQSDGRASVVEVTESGIGLDGYHQAFVPALAKVCPGCTTSLISLAYADAAAGNAPNAVVSYLRAHPGTKYVVLDLDSLGIGLPAALAAAGLTGIKTIGEGPDTTTLQYIASGQQAATVPFPYYELLGGLMIDAVLRKLTGQPVLNVQDPMPLWLVTKANLPSTQIFPIIADSQAQFFKLWGVK